MSNTLNLGGGKWATKQGSLLAYNSENNNYKPLPFTFDRASTATRVNKDGLIETVGANQPRVDYLNDSKGALLLEPSRTNLITFSEDFTEGVWSKTNTTVISNDTISPDGTLNASRLTDNTTDGLHVLGDGTSFESGETYTATIFAKKGTASRIFVGAGNPATWGADCYFDLENGTVALESIGTASIEDYGNGWYRCTVVGNANADAATNALFGLADNSNDKTYIGSGDYVYFWGAQLEQGYPTSYIKTQGSIVTRLADSCSQTPPDGVIGQTEGTIFVDVDFKTLSDTNMFVSIRPDSNNKIEIYRSDAIIYGEFVITNSFNFNKTNVTVGRYKIAVAYSSGSSAMYINGVLIGSNTTTFAFTSTLDSIYINSRGTSFIEQSNYNDLKLYNTRLSNAELAALTQV